MATHFGEIYPFVRRMLGDNDPHNYSYSIEVLRDHVRLVVMIVNKTTIQEDSSVPECFTDDLTAQEKAQVILRTVQSIVSPTPDEFQYKTPVLQIKKKGNAKFWSYLEQKIEEVEGGHTYIRHEGELDVFFKNAERLLNDFDKALTPDSE